MRLVETIMLKGFYITFDALKHHILLKKQGKSKWFAFDLYGGKMFW